MQQIQTDVLVIGGGATGLGTLRDLAMRGIHAILVEQGSLMHGTSGRYHGLLHSGARYVLHDPHSATECAHENMILRQTMPHCIEDTGGFFVTTPWDDPDYGDAFFAACRTTGVAVREIAIEDALQREPALNPRVSRVFAVNDATADSFAAAHALAHSARQYGAQLLMYHKVIDLICEDNRILGALVEDVFTGQCKRIEAAFTINAAGAWSGKIAALAGVPITLVPGKGTLIAMNHRMVNTVINRCKKPDDGDILVPIQTVAVIGTTDIPVNDPDEFAITPAEVTWLLEEGEKLVPGFASYRVLRSWAGVRPLYQEQEHEAASNRDMSRTYRLLDHSERDGVAGFLSIVGGKWTTFRLMAEQAANAVADRLGVTTPCRTHEEPLDEPDSTLSGSESRKFYWLGQNLAHVETGMTHGDLICECEIVSRQQVVECITAGTARTIDDIRRESRLGMGPCQGGFCAYRAVGLWQESSEQPVRRSSKSPLPLMPWGGLLLHFLQRRWKGVKPILWGDQLRQERLNQLIYLEILGSDLLPDYLIRQDKASYP